MARRSSVGEVSCEGTSVRYVRSIFLSGDETCPDLYAASSADAVAAVSRRAVVYFDRFVPYEHEERSPA